MGLLPPPPGQAPDLEAPQRRHRRHPGLVCQLARGPQRRIPHAQSRLMSSPILSAVLAVLTAVYVAAPSPDPLGAGGPTPPPTAAYPSGLGTGP
ncbi:hypothetical protein S2L_03 [Cyanophage S-2L]|nr:hypothetical protein S2L_03 [Cyanophage S-2L]